MATDAAGEGINLQRAHLMINYDLPWNPNRLEQRFGRIHRIGQTEVCHLWNLVAQETREGDVYLTLLRKLEQEREALGGAVFDVLGMALDGARAAQAADRGDPLRRPARGARPADPGGGRRRWTGAAARRCCEERALAARRDGRRRGGAASAWRWSGWRRGGCSRTSSPPSSRPPSQHLGGTLRERETGRYEITHVPAIIRQRDRVIGTREPVLTRYERVSFEKTLIAVPGKPLAAFVCPGHPLLDATIDLVLERYRDLMKQGAVLVDENDPGEELRALFYLEHSIQDARDRTAGRAADAWCRAGCSSWSVPASIRVRNPQSAIPRCRPGPVPGLPPAADRKSRHWWRRSWSRRSRPRNWRAEAIGYAIQDLVPRHLEEVRRVREPLIAKTTAAVKDRLTKEIAYWDHRAEDLKAQELAGQVNAKINSGKARQRADDLEARLRKPPGRAGAGAADRRPAAGRHRRGAGRAGRAAGAAAGRRQAAPALFARGDQRVEEAAMAAVMAAERAWATPRTMHTENRGYDIESLITGPGRRRPAALHRGQGAHRRRGDGDDQQERDPDRVQQARRLDPGAGRGAACARLRRGAGMVGEERPGYGAPAAVW